MKKTLAALAVLSAFSAGTMAANVQLYGIVDYGTVYTHQKAQLKAGANIHSLAFRDGPEINIPGLNAGLNFNRSNSVDGLALDSGVNANSRFGIKGSEDLGNGYTVSFKLENGFDADDGSFSDDNDRLFNREASLTVSAPWGTVSAGRMGALGSAAGSYDTVFAIGDAFDGGDNEIFSAAATDRYDNMITYQSPKVAGLQLTAQYSFKIDNKAEDLKGLIKMQEGHNSADRYAGLALTGEYGPFQGVVAYEQVMRSTSMLMIGNLSFFPDQKIFSIGGNYDLGMMKLFAMGQYYEGANLSSVGMNNFKANLSDRIGGLSKLADLGVDLLGHQAEGYSLHLGLQAPIAAGTLTAGLYYTDADMMQSVIDTLNGLANQYLPQDHVNVGLDNNFEEIGIAVKYEYPLSTRTTLYTGIGYAHTEFDNSVSISLSDLDLPVTDISGKVHADLEADTTQVYVGITHTF